MLPAHAAEPQFQLGDTLSIFSDKAIRKDGGEVFEAVGNVVVISGKDTLYGESAHFDRRTMIFTVEGNVRLNTQDITLYGSRLEYQALSGYAEIDNARIVDPRFTIVARKIVRKSEKLIVTLDSEFSSCRDCPESWSVFGKRIVVYLDDRAEIHHGLAKVKGISVLYIPYMVVPLKNRKTGLLFPDIFTRLGEGLGIAQPFFWAIDDSKDATITPTFWASRGYGSDLEYRQRFGPERWFQGNARVLNDKIYLPQENFTGQSESGLNYTRYFSDFENHWQWSPNWVHHLRDTSTRDLDIVRDFPTYTDERVLGSSLGFQGHVDGRGGLWALSLQGEYQKNLLTPDPLTFDQSYVQTMPRIALGTVPYSLVQSKTPLFQHIMIGADGSFTRFRQVRPTDETSNGPIRNADRITANPYLNWHFFTWGPLSVKTQAMLDYQKYSFADLGGVAAEKHATLLKTEAAFTMDRIFGLAYEEKVPLRDLPAETRRALRPVKEDGIKPLSSQTSGRKLVGVLPDFSTSLTEDEVPVARNSYRHSQEFKFIHHYITAEELSGNGRFRKQIELNRGWFDYTDAIRSQEYLLGANITRTIVPPGNTLEFQWNNVLIRKSPKNTDWRVDQRYLRDNFSYSKMGYFNVSQGYLLDEDLNEFRDRLTRLYVNAGYTADKWSLSSSEYYFHSNSQHIFQLGFQRQFDYLNFLSAYNYNSFGDIPLHTLSAGMQVRPIDTLGVSYQKLVDLEAKEDIRNIYTVDIMPNNECWILNLNYRESLVGYQFAFNIQFNFGDERFQNYRRDWFRFQRSTQ